MEDEPVHVEVPLNLKPLMGFFFDNRLELLEQAEEFSTAGKLQELRAIGHNFKGACGGYGFHELSRLGEHLQQAQNLEQARALLAQMRKHLEQVRVVYV
jgi:HPt (histidine-containing phosphotransfer) domain-containing protein